MIDDFMDILSKMVDVELVLQDFGIGVRYAYCAVKGKEVSVGLSYVLWEDLSMVGVAKKPSLRNIKKLAASTNMLDRVMCIAFANALSQYLIWVKGEVGCLIKEQNFIDFVARKIKRGDKIVVIGNMIPLVEKLKKVAKKVYVFERNPILRVFGANSDCFEYRYLEECDVLIASGSILVNDMVDPIVRFTSGARARYVVGPTAQLHPDILTNFFDAVGSTRVVDIDKAIEVVKLGGGRKELEKVCRDYVAIKE